MEKKEATDVQWPRGSRNEGSSRVRPPAGVEAAWLRWSPVIDGLDAGAQMIAHDAFEAGYFARDSLENRTSPR